MKYKLKKYKYIILSMVILLCFGFFAMYNYYQDNFSYWPEYYKIKDTCGENGIDPKSELCKYFTNEGSYERFVTGNDPVLKYKNLNAITLYNEVTQGPYAFAALQFLSPLFIILAVVGFIHSEWSSGMFKNYLLRTSYNKYRKKLLLIPWKTALLTPLLLLFIFIVSCLVTGFNFNLTPIIMEGVGYDKWTYDNFLIYFGIILFLQYLLNVLYGYIGLFVLRKNKNMIVSVIMGYLLFLLVHFFIYLGVYVFFLNKVLGFRELTDYFNITGYWFFIGDTNFVLLILIASTLAFISTTLLYFFYKKKEGMILAHEKQVA